MDILKRKQIVYVPNGPRGYSSYDTIKYATNSTISSTFSIDESYKYNTIICNSESILNLELHITNYPFTLNLLNIGDGTISLSSNNTLIGDNVLTKNKLYVLFKYDSDNILIN